jgi:hypothetical protein
MIQRSGWAPVIMADPVLSQPRKHDSESISEIRAQRHLSHPEQDLLTRFFKNARPAYSKLPLVCRIGAPPDRRNWPKADVQVLRRHVCFESGHQPAITEQSRFISNDLGSRQVG